MIRGKTDKERWLDGGSAPQEASKPECGVCHGDPAACDIHDCGDAHPKEASKAVPVADEPKPVAYRAWFDQDNGARWLFTLWPEEERLDVEWHPLYLRPSQQALGDGEIRQVIERFAGGCDWTDDEFDSAMRLAKDILAAAGERA